MKEYWLSDNKEMAANSTLYQLIGKLQAMQEWGKEPTCEELLKWIEANLTINTQTKQGGKVKKSHER